MIFPDSIIYFDIFLRTAAIAEKVWVFIASENDVTALYGDSRGDPPTPFAKVSLMQSAAF